MSTPPRKTLKRCTTAGTHATPTRILAVDPGSRYLGMAFLSGSDLVRADVETLREPGMRAAAITRKAERILAQWIRRYRPAVLAVETPGFAQSQRSAHLQQLVTTLTTVGRRHRLRIQFYPPTATRRFVCAQGRATRLAVARILATEYFPWLTPYYQKGVSKAWGRQHYWTRLFDAIAVGLTANGHLPPGRHGHPLPELFF